MVMAEPSSATPANKPLAREYEYTCAVSPISVAAELCRPTGPAATEASAPRVTLPPTMPSMLCFEVKTSTTSVDCTPTWKPKLPPVRLMKIGLLHAPVSLRTTSTPLPRRPPMPRPTLMTEGMTATA